MSEPRTLAALLHLTRHRAGLSQRALAAMLGCSHVNVGAIERGQRKWVQVDFVNRWLAATAKGVR